MKSRLDRRMTRMVYFHGKSIRRRIEAMRFRAAVALVTVALGLPAIAQHGGAHGGFSSHGGFSGHTGFSGYSGFSAPRGISRPGFAAGNPGFARPGFARIAPPSRTGFRSPYQGRGIASYRPSYRPGFGDRSRERDRDGRRGRWIGSYGYGYPGWPGYPYVIDPGFYDWGDSGDDSAYNQGGADPGYGPGYGYDPGYADAVPYTGYGDAPEGDAPQAPQWPAYSQAPAPQAPMARSPYAGSIADSSPVAEQPLTVIFKDGRTPAKMQNYMVNAEALTDLDQQHYEKIPLDQIDIAATEQTNRARGLDFHVPTTPSSE